MTAFDRRHLIQASAAFAAGSSFGIPFEVAAQAAAAACW